MTQDGWPVRRLKLIALIHAMEEISDAAKVVAAIWIEQSREGRILQMSTRELTRRRGRQKRENTSTVIGQLERALSARGWLVIDRPRTSRVFSGDLQISWPILAGRRASELHAAYDAAGLDPLGPRHPVSEGGGVPEMGQGGVPVLGLFDPKSGTLPVPSLGSNHPKSGTQISGPGSTGAREGRAHEKDQYDPRSIHDVLRRNFGR